MEELKALSESMGIQTKLKSKAEICDEIKLKISQEKEPKLEKLIKRYWFTMRVPMYQNKHQYQR